MHSASFEFIQQLVKQRAAIVIEPGKEYLAEARLAALARDEGHGDIEGLVSALRTRAHGELHRRVVELLTTNETTFFRDIRPFEALRKVVIPELLAARQDRPLTIWSAAASSGQEPYSVAMLLREHFPRAAATAKIIATDISRPMLARIERGVYSQFEIGRGLPAPMLVKYFVQRGGDWEVAPALRAMIEPRELNLASAFPPMPPVDLVLMRNVLIYFDVPTKRDILTRTRRVLASHGVLFLGAAESTLGIDAGYERSTAEKASYYRPQRPESPR